MHFPFRWYCLSTNQMLEQWLNFITCTAFCLDMQHTALYLRALLIGLKQFLRYWYAIILWEIYVAKSLWKCTISSKFISLFDCMNAWWYLENSCLNCMSLYVLSHLHVKIQTNAKKTYTMKTKSCPQNPNIKIICLLYTLHNILSNC